MKAVIVGGDAAGMSAAAKLKRLEPDARVTVYEKGPYLSYAACGLPYYVSGTVAEKKSLLQRTKEQFEATGVQPVLMHEVYKVLPEQKKVFVRNLETGEAFEDGYDKLMIATGAAPVAPPVRGTDLDGIFVLRTVDDAVLLRETLASDSIRDITIIGGGYISVETAEAIASAGKRIRIIQRPDRLLKNFDPQISALVKDELIRLGVDVRTGEELRGIEGAGRAERVITSKDAYDTDLVLLALGVRPATDFLSGSGIELAKNKAVIIDRMMRTNIDDIYSAGDCAEVYHRLKNKNDYIALATTANKCGRIAGINMAGGHSEFPGTLGSAALKVGELELARTGLSESEAKELGLDYKTVMVKAESRALYFPGGGPIWFRLIYENGTGRILGAQGAGRDGVVLRINTFACAITNNMTTEELGMTDTCYSPPFAGVWDAIHIAANAAKQ